MTDEIENILKTLESDRVLQDDRAKAYRNLNTLLKDENEKDSLYYMCSFLNRFLKRFMVDIDTGPDKVVQVALRVLGFVIHSASIVTYYNDTQVKDLVALLVRTITQAKEKVQCQLAVWCVSVQSINLLKVPLKPLVEALVYAIHSPFKSPGIETEAMNALGRLMVQVPTCMLQEIELWAPPIFTRLLMGDSASTNTTSSNGFTSNGLTSSAALREKAEVVWRLALPHLNPVPEALSTVVFSALTSNTCLFDALLGLLSLQDKEALHAVRVWGYLVLALGKYLLKGDLINQLLKIPNKTFLHASTSVRIATFQNWRCLIDNFSDGDSLNSTRRLKLLMMPFYNSITKDPDISARQAGFMTWAYLVSKVAAVKLLENSEVFKQVATSYLAHVVRDSEPDIYNLAFESVGLLLRTPDALEHDQSRALVRHTTLDIFAVIHLEMSPDLLLQQNGQSLAFFLEVVKVGATKSEHDATTFSLARDIWRNVLLRVACCEANSDMVHSCVSTAAELCSAHSMKYSSMLYDELLAVEGLRSALLAEHRDFDLNNQHVSLLAFLCHHWISLGNVNEPEAGNKENARSAKENANSTISKAQEIPDALVVGFDRILSLMSLMTSNPIAILQQMSSVLEQVEKSTAMYSDVNRGHLVLMLIWAMIAQKISGIITENPADVFGKASTVATINFINAALTMPLKETYCVILPPHIKTAWTNLFITYHRTASLKVADFHEHIDTLVLRFAELADAQSHRLSDLLVMAVGVVLSAVNLNIQSAESIANSRKKRKHTPIPQIPSLPPFLASLLYTLHNEINYSAPQLLRSIGKALSCQTLQDMECTLASLSDALVLWIKEPYPKSRDSIESPNKLASSGSESTTYVSQIKQAVDELWQEFISCVKRIYPSLRDEKHSMGHARLTEDQHSTGHSQLLTLIAPLLAAALSNKHRQIKNSAIQFWNETFARTTLKFVYPAALLPILVSLKEKTNIELPWFPSEQNNFDDKTKPHANSPSIPLEDQTFPPIPDVPIVQSSGIRDIALSIKQEGKGLKPQAREVAAKKLRGQYNKHSLALSAAGAGTSPTPRASHPRPPDPQPIPSEDPTPPSPPLAKSQLVCISGETRDPELEKTPTAVLEMLQSITGHVTKRDMTPWSNQQLLWAQKQALLIATALSDELSLHRTLP